MQGFLKLARPEGFEPPTDRFEADYSIQLSYERIRHKKALNIFHVRLTFLALPHRLEFGLYRQTT